MSEEDTDIGQPGGPVLEDENVAQADAESSIPEPDEVALPGEEMGNVDEQGPIHGPDETVPSGDEAGPAEEENVAQADGESSIPEPDEVAPPGEEMGNADEEGTIRLPDEIVVSDDEVGPVEDHEAHDSAGRVFPGEEWGHVDGEGNIHQKDGVTFKGRIIGKTKDKNKAATLAYFVLRFKEMEDRYKKLEHAVRTTENKPPFLGKIQHMLGYVPLTDALGDFESLIDGLKSLEQEILSQQDDNRQQKEELVRQAESLSSSTSWNKAAEQLKKLQALWKETRSAGKEHDDRLWQRFRSAQDEFFRRRSEHLDQESREMEENQRRKEQLCFMAESLCGSTDSNVMEQVRALQAEWETIGRVSKEYSDALWGMFKQACNLAYKNAKKEQKRIAAEREKRHREITESISNKHYLCTMAESLGHTSDTEEIRELQARWKSTGYVPKEEGDVLWERFRQACHRVFQNAREEQEQKWTEWRQKTQEALERKRDQAKRLRESIVHDEVNVERWQDAINHLRDGRQTDEIRASTESRIADVKNGIRSKRDRLNELEAAIRDMEKKLKKRSPSS